MSRGGLRRFGFDGLYTVRWDAGCCVFLKDGDSELRMDMCLIFFFPFSLLLIGIVTTELSKLSLTFWTTMGQHIP